MKNNIFILTALVATAMVSCRDYFDDKQLGNSHYRPTDIRTAMTYTLTDDDVAAIGKQCTYKGKDTVPSVYEQKALTLCSPDDSAAYTAWKRIAKEKAFNDDAGADIYVPMLMAQKFPYLDAGTICQVTYPLFEGKSARVEPFNYASPYTLVEEDYREIWGGRGADWLNTEKEDEVALLLQDRFPLAKDGKIVVVTYNFSTTSPEAIIPPLDYECSVKEFVEAQEKGIEHKVTGIVGAIKSPIYGRFYLKEGLDSVYVYGLTDADGNKVWKDKGIQEGDIITVRGRYSDETGEVRMTDAVYVSHTSADESPARRRRAVHDTQVKSVIYQLTEGNWHIYTNDQLATAEALPQSVYDALGVTTVANADEVIGKYLKNTYPFAQEKQIYLIAYNGKNGLTADEWTYNGTAFEMNTGYTTDVMSFVLNTSWVANISTYYTTPFVGDGPADFTIHHVALDGLSYVWRYQASYGMTASAYVSGTNHPVEDWLVSPKIRLKKSQNPQLTFDHAVRYGNQDYNRQWLKVMVTDNFTGDVTTTEWEHLPFPDSIPDGSNWVFLNTGNFSLSKYNGQTIVIGFCYNTTTGELTSAPTWEIQNLLVYEPETEE